MIHVELCASEHQAKEYDFTGSTLKVNLVAYTQPAKVYDWTDSTDPVAIVEECASICYNSNPTTTFAIAKGCARSGHMSVWEHIGFVFRVDGVSRALLAQLTRHRIAGFSVRSQRYCNESGFGFVEPPKIEADTYMHNCFNDAMEYANTRYEELLALGAAPEDARFVLPNACETSLYVSANARSLIGMSHLRLCSRAQKEIRELFQAIKREVDSVSPATAELMVPTCEIHPEYPFCSELKCCGRHPRLSEVYNPPKK